MAEKLDRKQLKRPDEFQVVAGRAMNWMVAHRNLSLGAAGGILALALIVWGVSAFRNSREAKAGAELAEALEIQSRPVAGEGQPPHPGQDTFASAQEREKALITALEKVRADHGGTTAAQTALAELGFFKLKSGDATGAQKDLQDFLDRAGDHPLRPFAQESLGYSLEAQKKLGEARAAFEKLREMGLPARADYQAARLALIEGKPDARQQLERVAKEHPKELEVVREANARLELASIPPITPGQAAPVPAKAPLEKKPQGKKQK